MLNCKVQKIVLIVAPHPDDAELAMGGTIAKMIDADHYVTIVDLTDGEPTPFGTPAIRRQETKLATEILGVQNRLCLNMPNRRLEASFENRRQLAEVIRLTRPDIIFGPCRPDWHPDHVAATQLVEDARFEAKYHKTDMKGQPHWTPHLCYYYSLHRSEYQKPSFVVDVSPYWKTKKDAISAYKSQLKNTQAGCRTLLERHEIINGFFGLSISAQYGEPFISDRPLLDRTTAFS